MALWVGTLQTGRNRAMHQTEVYEGLSSIEVAFSFDILMALSIPPPIMAKKYNISP
jgi:hypothetical protein